MKYSPSIWDIKAYNRVELYWLSGDTVSSDMVLEVSNDAVNWNEIANVKGYTSSDYTGTGVNVPASAGRYLRVSSKASTGNLLPLTEIKVFLDAPVMTDIILDGKYAYGIEAGETAGEHSAVTITDGDRILGANDVIGTGMTLTSGNSGYAVVIKGDVNGDGKINSTDFTWVRRGYLNLFELEEVNSLAADVDENGRIDSTDFTRIRRHYLELFDLYA